ncbi:MAG: hypothetical protein K6B43_08105 [Treponema sp.]|nr:hypothetical protein [Treponema sp.]
MPPRNALPVTKSEYNKKLFDVFLKMFESLKDSILNWKNSENELILNWKNSENELPEHQIVMSKTEEQYFVFRSNITEQVWTETEFSDLADKCSVFAKKREFPNDDELNIISKHYNSAPNMRFVVDETHEKVKKGSLDAPIWKLEKLSKSYPVMVYRFGNADNDDEFVLQLLRNNLRPASISAADIFLFDRIVSILEKYPDFVKIQMGALKFNQEYFRRYLSENTKFADDLKHSDFYKPMTSEEAYALLLFCDKIRAGLPEHSPEELTGANQGHWDLYADANDVAAYVDICTEGTLIPRNPKDDVKSSGTVGIDFGTKSTVVVGWPGVGEPMPISISYERDVSKRFENPTVMQFVDIDRFLNDYDSKKGRPNTRWEDLNVSHFAAEQFISNEEKERNDSFLYQIKQWAGDSNRIQLIKTKNGNIEELKPFLDIEDGDLDPIEYYAYYIGLYINQMNRNVYLNYNLAFPVTYSVEVRDKIVKSFEKGLKKSLPEAILNDDDLMKKFKVNGRICEPTAYAATALRKYGFKPELDKKIRYAVFDFGGGTSDFDYGTFGKSKSEKYVYELDNFTQHADGNRTLGGENLLEDLAFKIFKDNRSVLFDGDEEYHFCFGSVAEPFPGWEDLIGTRPSQFAHKNMHNLMEALRKYWEGEASKDYQRSAIRRNLEEYANPDSYIDEEDLLEFVYQIKALLEKSKDSFDDAASADKAMNELLTIEKNLTEKGETKAFSSLLHRNESRSDKITAARNSLHNFYSDYLEDMGAELCGDDEPFEEIKIVAWSEKGNPNASFTVCNIRKTDIFKFFEERIRSGVKTFILRLKEAFEFTGNADSEKVNIFLAGNSCKSPIFRAVFKEEIKKFEADINHDGENCLFEIFPPLGSDEAKRKMQSRGITSFNEGINGKTGVAYGLIDCSTAGGSIKTNKIIRAEELQQWYIGKVSDDKFSCIGDESHRCKLNKWYKIRKVECDEADEPDFVRIGYTRNGECIQNNLSKDDSEIYWDGFGCNVDGATFFVKAVDSSTIVCVAANTDDPDDVDSNKITESEKVIKLKV